MSLQDLKEQASKLPARDRLELISTIIQSLKGSPQAEAWQFLVSRPRKSVHYFKPVELLSAGLNQ
jgi:hypothetical protein